MGLGGIITGILSGTFVDEDRRREELQKQELYLDGLAAKRGIWTAEEQRTVDDHRRTEAEQYAETGDLAAEFAPMELAKNVRDSANKVAGDAFKFTFTAIPWWVWLAVLLYLAWHVGLLKGLFKRA